MGMRLTQPYTRYSDGPCQAYKDLISGFSAIEVETELVQIRLKNGATAAIGVKQECLQVSDSAGQLAFQAALRYLYRL